MENGFIRDMLDVKVLILYVADLAAVPMDAQTIYELCYVDDRLTYFDVCEALPELVESGHLSVDGRKRYTITEKGKENISVTGDSVAFTVRMSARETVERYKAKLEQSRTTRTAVKEYDGSYSAYVEYGDEGDTLFRMELAAADKQQARKLCTVLNGNAAQLYNVIMGDLLEEMEEN